MASEILLEGIIVVFHTLTLAVGTHLEKYMQYSAEESILYNSANWALSRDSENDCNSHPFLQPREDEEQTLNVTYKSANRIQLGFSGSHISFRSNSSLSIQHWTVAHGILHFIHST